MYSRHRLLSVCLGLLEAPVVGKVRWQSSRFLPCGEKGWVSLFRETKPLVVILFIVAVSYGTWNPVTFLARTYLGRARAMLSLEMSPIRHARISTFSVRRLGVCFREVPEISPKRAIKWAACWSIFRCVDRGLSLEKSLPKAKPQYGPVSTARYALFGASSIRVLC